MRVHRETIETVRSGLESRLNRLDRMGHGPGEEMCHQL